jgi:hypothetical protein
VPIQDRHPEFISGLVPHRIIEHGSLLRHKAPSHSCTDVIKTHPKSKIRLHHVQADYQSDLDESFLLILFVCWYKSAPHTDNIEKKVKVELNQAYAKEHI